MKLSKDERGALVGRVATSLASAHEAHCLVVLGCEDATVMGAWGNVAGIAWMLQAAAEQVATSPRSTDCPACAAAHGRITMALACLRAPEGEACA